MYVADDLKRVATTVIDQYSGQLAELSHDIWSHPELCFKEHHAHSVLTTFLEQAGFPSVDKSYVLDTGFRAVYGSGDGVPHVAVICEYDALPEIGHACGHNLIAEAGAGAAIGIKAAMDAAREDGKDIGKVTKSMVKFGTRET